MKNSRPSTKLDRLSLNNWLSLLESRYPNPIELGLERVRYVANQLNLLAIDIPVITVAGTNGKGSTVSILESIYTQSGYHVGSYTSPHLFSFNERIRINHEPVADIVICEAFSAIEQARGDIKLTYFEVSTLAALWCFSQRELDILILEVGMGGRLDAVNIIDASVSIITTIDLDHQSFLGSTREAIGAEKAGIARKDKPVIFADINIPDTIVKYTEQIGANLIQLNRDYFLNIGLKSNSTYMYQYGDFKFVFQNTLFHEHNIAAAISAILSLNDLLPVNNTNIGIGVEKAKLVGRLMLLEGAPQILVDVAHNLQAVKLLKERIKALDVKGCIYAVFGVLNDKDHLTIISELEDVVGVWCPTILPCTRSLQKDILSSAFKRFGLDCFVNNSPEQALDLAIKDAEPNDLIVVFGSFYTVSAVLKHMQTNSTRDRRALKIQ